MTTRTQSPRPQIPRPPSLDRLELLDQTGTGLRLSVYAPLPASRGFDELRRFPLDFERTAEAALGRLELLEPPAGDVERARADLHSVEVEVASLPRRTRAIGVLSGPDGAEAFALLSETPTAVRAGRSFHIRPILRALRHEFVHRVLALSNNRVALYEGDAHGLREVEAPDVPGSLEDALGSQLTDPSLQFHSTARGGEAAVFHGHGGADRGRDDDRARFHRAVALSVEKHWRGRRDPLVLATDAANDGEFRKRASLPGMVEETAIGNPDRLSAHELHERSAPLVRDWIVARDRRDWERALESNAVENIGAAAELAVAGRVERLWIDRETSVPGHLDRGTGRVERALGDEDALDELASAVLALGGDVRVLDEHIDSNGTLLLAELRG